MQKQEKKRSIFERLAGGIRLTEDSDTTEQEVPYHSGRKVAAVSEDETTSQWNSTNTDDEDCELALDVYQTATDVIVHTFVAGVKPEDLEINITRDSLTIRGKRQDVHTTHKGDFFAKELYWGSFSRTVALPQEVEPDEAEAIERHGLLTIRLPKIDKHRQSNLKVKSV